MKLRSFGGRTVSLLTAFITVWAVCLLMFGVGLVVAASDTAPAPSPVFQFVGTLLTLLTPVLVPMVVALAKKAIAGMPSWLLPIAATLLGGLIDLINAFATGSTVGVGWGLLLGAAGVGVREIYNQLFGVRPVATTTRTATGATGSGLR